MRQQHRLQRVSVGLSDSEVAELKALAEANRISQAWIGRQAIVEFLERHRDRELQLPLAITKPGRKASNG